MHMMMMTTTTTTTTTTTGVAAHEEGPGTSAPDAAMGQPHQQQQQQRQGEEEKGEGHLDRLPPKAIALLFTLLPTPGLLALRCCSKAHYARFHAPGAPHWDAVSQRLVVELHASRLRLATASDIVGPPAAHGGQGGEGEEEEEHAAPPKRLVARPLVVGHRGASGHRPGNSLESFHHAVELGADMIELDVCLDKSGLVIVHHDSYLKATGQLLSTLTLAEIKRVAPEVQPLTVVLEELRASGVSLYLDLKTDSVVPPLMRILHEAIEAGGWHPSRLLIASFNQHDIGIEVNAHRLAFPHTLNQIQTCIIVDGVPISFAKQYSQLGVSWCSIGDGCVLPSFVEDAHSRGIGVMVWTVNNPSMMQRYLDLGVDALVTDYPERAIAVRAQAEAAEQQTRGQQQRQQASSSSSSSSSSPSSSHPQGSPKRPREPSSSSSSPSSPRRGSNGNGSNGTSSPLLSAYPTALHQPRKRLVQALRQAWPLLRALEGRRPHASHSPPTPTANQARRQQLLSFGGGPKTQGGGSDAGSTAGSESDPGASAAASSSSSSAAAPVGAGLVAHLKAAAQQAEEVATAVLQPRLLPRRHHQRRQRQRQEQQEEGAKAEGDAEEEPQTPPRAEEGGEKGSGGGAGPVPTACGLTASLSSSTSSTGSSQEEQEREREREHEHDAPFLPFERKWAAQAASYS